MRVNLIFYDHPALTGPLPHSIFLVGPSVGRETGLDRTPWRDSVIRALTDYPSERGITLIVPEFERGGFRRTPFDDGKPSTTPGMERASEHIVEWECAGIDNARVILAWMPFRLGESDADPARRLGFSTRAEVSRLVEQGRRNLLLGMPPDAVAGGQIRYHAHRKGWRIAEDLSSMLPTALSLAFD